MIRLGRLLLAIPLAFVPLIQDARSEGLLINQTTEWMSVQRSKKIRVEVNDEVKDGCWRSPADAKTAVELEYIRSGFEINESSLAFVRLSAVGYKQKQTGLCAVSYMLKFNVLDIDQLHQNGHILFGGTIDKTLYQDVGIMTGGPIQTSDGLKSTFADLAKSALVHQAKQIQLIKTELANHKDQTEAAFWLGWLNGATPR